jgi:hypothetical protein
VDVYAITESGQHISDMISARVLEKVGWVKAAAAAAGRSTADIEFEAAIYVFEITETSAAAREARERLAASVGLDAASVEDAASVLVGTLDECAVRLCGPMFRVGRTVVQRRDLSVDQTSGAGEADLVWSV